MIRPTATALMLILLGCLLIAFVLVRSSDQRYFLLLNELHSPVSDRLWLAFTSLGDGMVLALLLGAFLVVNPRVSALGVFLIVVSGIAVQIAKGSMPASRPVELLNSVHVVGPLLRSGSFPSGHATSGMVAALVVVYYSGSRLVSVSAMIFAALVGVSRVFVGAHFPGDVLGGMILASCIFFFVISIIWPRWERHIPARPKIEKSGFRTLLYLEFFAALFVLSVYAPFFSDFPFVAGSVGFLVAAFLAYAWFRTGHEGSAT
ncbi:MAG: phosphatase PAP2 family protein [Deltaproteobacteria bacterium]|nr:phosphatase PAP2 family protein [Deltaproteobacteria bacterium]